MLTLLGVVIGVMSVIAVVSIVNGLNSYVAEKIFNLGADVFLVSRGPIIITNIDEYQETQKRRKFRLDDYEALRDACRSCAEVGASIDHMNAQVKYGTDYLSNAHVLGWTPDMPLIYELDLVAGRHINQTDVSQSAPVCTVGWDIADKLLPASDPIGKEIRVDTAQCEVIGVGKKLGSVMGQSRDNWIIFPITTFQKTYSSDDSIRIWAKSGGTKTLRADDGRSPPDPARPPARGVQLAGRFHHRDERVVSFAVGQHQRRVFRRDHRDRFHLADGRRNRDHEHHAGFGYGAHARDRACGNPSARGRAISGCSS